MLLAILCWTLVGLGIGFAVSRVVDVRGDDPRLGMAVGLIAGLLGGWGYRLIADDGTSPLTLWSTVSAAIAALLAVAAWHIVRRRSPYARPTIRRSY